MSIMAIVRTAGEVGLKNLNRTILTKEGKRDGLFQQFTQRKE
jgi:hypothetical protein